MYSRLWRHCGSVTNDGERGEHVDLRLGMEVFHDHKSTLNYLDPRVRRLRIGTRREHDIGHDTDDCVGCIRQCGK